MPVEFLSVEQGAGFGRFAGELSQSDLDRFFYLDDADRDLVAVRSGDHNRLGFAVQLGTVRFLGAFLADPLDVPWGVVEYLAAQLEITEPLVVRKYTQRVPTANEHAREIRANCGYRDLDGPLGEKLTLGSADPAGAGVAEVRDRRDSAAVRAVTRALALPRSTITEDVAAKRLGLCQPVFRRRGPAWRWLHMGSGGFFPSCKRMGR